jgi:hypothetical protein
MRIIPLIDNPTRYEDVYGDDISPPFTPSLSGSIPMGHGTNKWTSLLTIVEDPNYREGINQLYYYGVIFSGNGGGTNLNSSRVSNDFSLILPR